MTLEPAIATVVLGLMAAVAFGASDFGGGLVTRRARLLGVVLISQACSVVVAVGLAVIAGEAVPDRPDLAWSVLAGIFGATAISALYRGLAVGRMGLVAPVTAVLASTIPVVGGIILQGVPPLVVSIGIGIALAAVVLISWESGADRAGRAGLWLAVLSGSAFGLYEITVAQISADAVLGPLAIIRATQAALVAVVIVLTRTAWRPERPLLPAIAAIGVLEMAANGLFLVAVQTGSLAVASVVSSLYPIVTILLATVLLREPVGRRHGVGIGLAMLAIVLIGAGST
jgi:drug/metabolite transporter (DMT)-like permease